MSNTQLFVALDVDDCQELFEVAKELAQIPANVFSLSKRQLRRPAQDRIASARREFESEIDEIWFSDEIRTVVREYVARRLKK